MTVLVPGLHLLDGDVYAQGGLSRQLSACSAADAADPWIEEYVLTS